MFLSRLNDSRHHFLLVPGTGDRKFPLKEVKEFGGLIWECPLISKSPWILRSDYKSSRKNM